MSEEEINELKNKLFHLLMDFCGEWRWQKKVSQRFIATRNRFIGRCYMSRRKRSWPMSLRWNLLRHCILPAD